MITPQQVIALCAKDGNKTPSISQEEIERFKRIFPCYYRYDLPVNVMALCFEMLDIDADEAVQALYLQEQLKPWLIELKSI